MNSPLHFRINPVYNHLVEIGNSELPVRNWSLGRIWRWSVLWRKDREGTRRQIPELKIYVEISPRSQRIRIFFRTKVAHIALRFPSRHLQATNRTAEAQGWSFGSEVIWKIEIFENYQTRQSQNVPKTNSPTTYFPVLFLFREV